MKIFHQNYNYRELYCGKKLEKGGKNLYNNKKFINYKFFINKGII